MFRVETPSLKEALLLGCCCGREVDRSTGFRTRAVLCMPVCLKSRQTLAVVQVINKRTGKPYFDEQDEAAMEAFCQEVITASVMATQNH